MITFKHEWNWSSKSVQWIRLSTFTSTSEQIIAIHSCQALWAKNTHEALRGWLELDAPSRRKNGRTAFWKGTMVSDWAPSSDGRNTCIFVCHGCFPVSSFGYTYYETFKEHVTCEMWFGFASTSTCIIRRDSCMQAVRLGGGSILWSAAERHDTILYHGIPRNCFFLFDGILLVIFKLGIDAVGVSFQAYYEQSEDVVFHSAIIIGLAAVTGFKGTSHCMTLGRLTTRAGFCRQYIHVGLFSSPLWTWVIDERRGCVLTYSVKINEPLNPLTPGYGI